MSLAHKLEPVFSTTPQRVSVHQVRHEKLSLAELQAMLDKRNRRDLTLVCSSSDNMHHI